MLTCSFMILYAVIASSPGLPMCFNVTRKKSGRPDWFCDIICHDFCCGSLSPPTCPRNHVHIVSYGSLRASNNTVANRSYQESYQQKLATLGVWDRPATLRQVAKKNIYDCSKVASSSCSHVQICNDEIGDTSTMLSSTKLLTRWAKRLSRWQQKCCWSRHCQIWIWTRASYSRTYIYIP